MNNRLFTIIAYVGLLISIPYAFGSEPQLIETFQPDMEILPDENVFYGDSFTINAWLQSYDDLPDGLGYYIDVLDPDHNQVDSTLWFVKEDFVYEFDTTHPAYNIAKGGIYQIKIEKADFMERTEIFPKIIEFEIIFPEQEKHHDVKSPLKQFKSGISVDQIQCNKNLVLIQKYDGSPVCVKSLTAEKLIEHGSFIGLQVLTNPKYSISTGTHSGFCIGYCSTSFIITPDHITILKTGSTRETQLLDQAIQVQFSEKDWNRIIDSIDFQKFVTLPDKIGCPGCADAPVNWIEISDGNQTKKIEYENQDNIPEIKQLRAILEEITTTLNTKLDQSDNKIITLDEKDKLIEIKKGEKFLVQLDSIYDWRIDIDNKTVVDSDYSDIRYSGSQAVYLAHNLGNATITGIGDPRCQSLEPPCMSPSILFQIDVRVE